MGTTYTVVYAGNTTYQSEFDSLLRVLNDEVSTYIPTSTISRFNQSDSTLFETGMPVNVEGKVHLPDHHFWVNLDQSRSLIRLTNGYFGPTVMPLVNYWGFGYKEKRAVTEVDSQKISSLKQLVGLEQIREEPGRRQRSLRKKDKKVQLDFSALAKGYGVDLLGQFLEEQGVNDYQVEIGGEVRCRGKNAKGNWWKIGINKPKTDASLVELEAAVTLRNKSMATSGNYRNFYEVNGKKYGHTINPKTGFPEQSSLLSASIFADDCLTADALSTASMAMGLDRAFELVESNPNLEGFFIYGDETGQFSYKETSGLKGLIEEIGK